MTKNVAWFTSGTPRDVVERLLRLGLSLRNPVTGRFKLFSNAGEELAVHDEKEAISLLLNGNGASLWLAGDQDLFISFDGGTLCASFDGFTEAEESALLSKLRSAGLTCVLADEDSPPPANGS